MRALLLRRFASLVVTLILASGAIFTLAELLPGDPAAVMLGTSARPDTLRALRADMGLDRPAPVRYAAWLGGALTGRFGSSVAYGVPVSDLIAERLVVTLPLTGLAILISTAIALPLGIAAAARRGGLVDALATFGAQAAIALPNFWIGLLLVLLFAVSLGWLPANGFPGWHAGSVAALRALVLPAVSLALPQAGVLTRVTRAAVLDVLHEDYVRTARAKGLTRRAALLRHALPNALPPILTIFGLQLSFLVAGSVLVENVFDLPGLGRLAIQAFARRDLVVVEDVVLFLATVVIVMNAAVDLAQLALDARLRTT